MVLCAVVARCGGNEDSGDGKDGDGRLVGSWKTAFATTGEKVPSGVGRRYLRGNPLCFELPSGGKERIVKDGEDVKGNWRRREGDCSMRGCCRIFRGILPSNLG